MSGQRPVLLQTAAAAAQRDFAKVDDAKRRAKWPWWRDRCPFAIFSNQLREPVLLVDFELLRNAAALVLGREVQPLEFTRPAQLLREYRALFPQSRRRCSCSYGG